MPRKTLSVGRPDVHSIIRFPTVLVSQRAKFFVAFVERIDRVTFDLFDVQHVARFVVFVVRVEQIDKSEASFLQRRAERTERLSGNICRFFSVLRSNLIIELHWFRGA